MKKDSYMSLMTKMMLRKAIMALICKWVKKAKQTNSMVSSSKNNKSLIT